MWKLVLFTCKFWFTYVNRTNFHTKGFALGLYLKQLQKGLRNCLLHATLHRVSSPLLRLEMSLHQRGSFSTSCWKICAYKVHNSFCNKKPDNSRITSILLVLFSYWTYTYTTSTTPQYMWLSTDNFIHMQWFLWLGIYANLTNHASRLFLYLEKCLILVVHRMLSTLRENVRALYTVHH